MNSIGGYLTGKLRDTVLYDWNQTMASYPSESTLQELFEAQAAKTPEAIALVYNERQLTYQELNEKSNRLAHYLKTHYGIQADDLVVLCLDRSEGMLVNILGVLKSGGAYVPMDPGYPEDRIKYILNDTGSRVVITNEAYVDKFSSCRIDVLAIDSSGAQEALQHYPLTNPATGTISTDLAYVIYTSGTTGRPKGVMVEHGSVVNRISWMNAAYPLKSEDRILQKTPYTFDVSVWEFFWANWYGAAIVFAKPEGQGDSHYLAELIAKEQISVIHFVPSMLDAFEDTLENDIFLQAYCGSLRYLFCSGEALTLKQVKKAHRLLPSAAIHNLYGPTETTVDVLHYDCTDRSIKSILIGRPISNTSVYVLDKHQQLLPLGAVGELYIGGTGVARGYLNQEVLTKERFIANPFQSEEEKEREYNGRLYKTGDLVRYHADGNIEYIGRNDMQVKLRGYRIELGEIEAKLNDYVGIRQSVVIAKEPIEGNKYLVGYYVSEAEIAEEALRDRLSLSLPDYMVPTVLMRIEHVPLTLNGKLDRNRLPEVEFNNAEDYQRPETELETLLQRIWGEVLGIEKTIVSVNADFFHLGGNSIQAIRLVNRMNEALSSGLRISDLFQYKTIRDLCHCLVSGSLLQTVDIHAPAVDSPEDQLLSYAQQRLWFIDVYENGCGAYNIPIALKLSPLVDEGRLEDVLRIIIHRHEVLHSCIKTSSNGSVYQQAIDEIIRPLKMCRENYLTIEALDRALWLSSQRIFDLSLEYPIELKLYSLVVDGFESRYLGITVHHIAFDGWSIDIFVRELLDFYYGDNSLPSLKLQYKEYALWQREYLTGKILENQLNYWKLHLLGHEQLSLPLDNARPMKWSYRGADINFKIDADTTQALRDLASELRVSIYSLLLSSYYLLLYAYSGQENIVIGIPISNRHHQQTADMIGFFVNALALRWEINASKCLRDFIQDVGHMVEEAQGHQDLPFERLVKELQIKQDSSRHPLFQTMFVLDSIDRGLIKEGNLFSIYQPEHNYTTAKFDLTLNINADDQELEGCFNYATDLFTHQTIENYILTYRQLLKQLSGLNKSAINTKIRDLTYLDTNQYKQQVINWNATTVVYPDEKTVNVLFEEQVLRTPDQIAVVSGNNRISYKELNERSNQLAHYLRKHYDIQPDDLVILCLDRSAYMLISMLGILKAGGAYVPADPGYPSERLCYMIRDTRSKIVLTNEKYESLLSDLQLEEAVGVLSIDSAKMEEELRGYPLNNPGAASSSSDLAYVIYTSGTTGQPKGVMVEHRNVMNYLQTVHGMLPADVERVDFSGSLTFDLSVTVTLYPLCFGKVVFIYEGHLTDIKAYKKHLLINFIHLIKSTPSFISLLTGDLNEGSDLNLKIAIVGGEKLLSVHAKPMLAIVDKIIDEYGPTETTVGTTHYAISDQTECYLIGRPISNTTTYILDKCRRPLPVGAIGELYIGGSGVARGYLNREELTNERFIVNPFQQEEEKKRGYNHRLYKTGDLVRYHADGNIEYIGRNDFQVKIRGYRIELGEIESTLTGYAGITQSVVTVHEPENGHKYLVGYYVSSEILNTSDIENYLSERLPDYMMPSVLVHLRELPLTVNGKLDRRALPVPELQSGNTFQAPQTTLQKHLCAIWGDILGLDAENIGIDDDFFRLGGDSIMAARLVSKINKGLGSTLKVVDFFTYCKCIRDLSSRLIDNGVASQTIIPLNTTINKPSLFMIHPGGFGCEVYVSFAENLSSYYQCYGVDSYNVYHTDKISDLNKLSEYYLTEIDKVKKLQGGGLYSYDLLGWSLGGQIAMEIAAILESRGIENINVYLLDTILDGESSEENVDEIINDILEKSTDNTKEKGAYKIKLEALVKAELSIRRQSISTNLKYTQVVLFKALKQLKNGINEQFISDSSTLSTDNGIGQVLGCNSQLTIINMANVNHHTILEDQEILVSELAKRTINHYGSDIKIK